MTLHTNLGDIKCEIACDEVPKTAEVCLCLILFVSNFNVIIKVKIAKRSEFISLTIFEFT